MLPCDKKKIPYPVFNTRPIDVLNTSKLGTGDGIKYSHVHTGFLDMQGRVAPANTGTTGWGRVGSSRRYTLFTFRHLWWQETYETQLSVCLSLRTTRKSF